jgi:hypothetical protein
LLIAYIKKHKWHVEKVSKTIAVTKNTDKQKTELMVFNYDKRLCRSSIPQKDLIAIESKLKKLKFT